MSLRLSVHSHLRLSCFKFCLKGRLLVERKLKTIFMQNFVEKTNYIKENVKGANGEPLNKHPFTLVNNLLHTDDIKWTAFFFSRC